MTFRTMSFAYALLWHNLASQCWLFLLPMFTSRYVRPCALLRIGIVLSPRLPRAEVLRVAGGPVRARACCDVASAPLFLVGPRALARSPRPAGLGLANKAVRLELIAVVPVVKEELLATGDGPMRV